MTRIYFLLTLSFFIFGCASKPVNSVSCPSEKSPGKILKLTKSDLLNRIKGGWAGQTIGCGFGGPTEFCYRGVMIPDERVLEYPDGMLKDLFKRVPTLYDDVYMDLSFLKVIERDGFSAPAENFAKEFAYADYMLWHANQNGRYNVARGIMPPESGHWLNNPHADCIDYQIEADYAGLLSPAMPNTASEISDKVGHIMNYGDGWYGGVFVGALYTQAFLYDDVMTVVTEALKTIPQESKYYHCISDTINWYKENPKDWKSCWRKYNEKYSKDYGCPELVLEAGNIDATMNSAYVVMGLLYGEKDFGKTMEVATRCGQDSDCNPSTAAGVLGVMIGYDKIPDQWLNNLKEVEDLPFPYNTWTLNDIYKVNFDLALKNIERAGGTVTKNDVLIAVQDPKPVRFEESFPNMEPYLIAAKTEWLGTDKAKANTFIFHGTGFAIYGDLLANNPDYWGEFAVIIDGKQDHIMRLSPRYHDRLDNPFWRYGLEDGAHTVTIKLLNPPEDNSANMRVKKVIGYSPKD